MTLEDLSTMIAEARWFDRVGKCDGRGDSLPLSAVASTDTWDWLPTSREQPDPVHRDTLAELVEAEGKTPERQQAELSAAKQAMTSLRRVPMCHPMLNDGPHDYTTAARGAAVYAARMAAREIVAGFPGFWCQVMDLYHSGYWPCGRMDDGRLVVYSAGGASGGV